MGVEELVYARRRRAAERAQVGDTPTVEVIAAELRKFYHPKQGRFFTSKARRRATKKTRRIGATAGGCRELIARAVETPRFRAVYLTTTRIEARARAWRNDTQSGLVDIIERYGNPLDLPGVPHFDLGGVTVEVRDGELALRFSNGSLIELYGADDEAAINKLRGLAKNVWWVDEAQDFVWLERLFRSVITAGSADKGGDVWLTGTPSRDLVGMFYEVTRDDVENRLKGWEVHEITVVDNPFFGRMVWERGEWFVEDNLFYVGDEAGRATHQWTSEISADAHRWGPFETEDDAEAAAIKVRWERAAAADIRENGWDDDDPDVQREWKARWVKEGARYVYALNQVNEHEVVYAPPRFADDGFPDLRAALLDLPGVKDEQRTYFTALGADLGTRDAFAWVVWAWSLKDPILYELASWKKTGLDYDQMAEYLHAVRAQLNLSVIVADAGGGGKAAVMGWSKKWMDRYRIPITEAKKAPGYKPIAIKQLNTDIRRGWLRLRQDSPLMAEWRVHRWAPVRDASGKETEDPRTPNHCCFVAGTMVETELGPVAIEGILPGCRVWTRTGLRRVVDAWCTGERPTWRLVSDADELVGTADHPIWVGDRWCELSLLTEAHTLTSWQTSTDRRRSSSSTGRSTDGTHSRQYVRSRSTSLEAKAKASIVTSGHRCMVRFLMAITFTIATAILRTTWSTISSASMVGSTSAFTCGHQSGSRWRGSRSELLVMPQHSGTALRKEGLGTRTMGSELLQVVLDTIAHAWFVVARFSRRSEMPRCAAISATPSVDVIPASTTPSVCAQGAVPSSRETGIGRPATAPSRVRCVHPTGRVELVYNLTVEDDHEYFANGILVSNCDGALYSHMESYHHRYRPEEPKVVPGTPEWVIREERELEATALDQVDHQDPYAIYGAYR